MPQGWRKAYPKWIAKGSMDSKKAEREIEIMEAIVEQLERDAGRRE